MRKPEAGLGTRERILEAAGEVFAERGFAAATVRAICRRARVNVAAVNYHFGDKVGLYAQVLHDAHRCALEAYPPTLGLPPGASAQDELHAFVRSLLLRMFQDDRTAWYGKLMAREMIEPTRALDTLVEQSIRPQYEWLISIVWKLVGDRVSSAQVRLCAISVVGQCLHYRHARPVITRLEPEMTYRPAEIEALASHITAFSLAAMRHLPERNGGSP